MAPNSVRIVLLCEDEAQERLLRPVCRKRFGDVRVRRAPQGKGSACAWVISQYPREVRALRSKGLQRVGLVVVVDGDRSGVNGRRKELAAALGSAGLAPVGAKERIALCIPTWSIETWLLALTGDTSVDEARSCKREWNRVPDAKRRAREAVGIWLTPGISISLPSLRDGFRELDRLA